MATILSHPLTGNYGGMLQAYALTKTIHSVRLNVLYWDYEPDDLKQLFHSPLSRLKEIVRILLYRARQSEFCPYSTKKKTISSFKSLWKMYLSTQNGNLKSNQAFIVGSDQIWRASYCRSMKSTGFFFLDFATRKQRKRSISYAASFGSDEWEGTPEETEECGRLLREFKAVSVRERSGVKICKEVFGVDAVQMPDPTLLLHTSDYGKIIDSEKTWLPESKYVAAYVLDETAGKAELLQESTETLNLKLQHLMPHAPAKKRRDRFPISVPQWLRLIRDCEYFITDSFHGCVFAIIYNKPFVCLGNEGRGNARFDTLLGTFGLEDRMITHASPEEIQRVLNTPIDWERVNAIHDDERERGINFLKENLAES